jgi:hypothetical protein
MRAVALTVAALALASVLAAAAPPTPIPSGLRGEVTRGPTKPVCRDDEPCEAPAVGVVLRFSRDGEVVARARTGAGGTYTLRLRPGVYAVNTGQTRIGTTLTPRRVRVPVARVARVDFYIDTGIQ